MKDILKEIQVQCREMVIKTRKDWTSFMHESWIMMQLETTKDSWNLHSEKIADIKT